MNTRLKSRDGSPSPKGLRRSTSLHLTGAESWGHELQKDLGSDLQQIYQLEERLDSRITSGFIHLETVIKNEIQQLQIDLNKQLKSDIQQLQIDLNKELKSDMKQMKQELSQELSQVIQNALKGEVNKITQVFAQTADFANKMASSLQNNKV